MSYLDNNFNQLREKIKKGRDTFSNKGYDNFYYLIFEPSEILSVKRKEKDWILKLKHDGWEIQTFSVFQNIWKIIEGNKRWEIYKNAGEKNPLDWDKMNLSLREILINETNGLISKFKEKLNKFNEKEKNIMLVTDIEALHPYMRIGTIEAQLQGQFNTTIIFLYPGKRTGDTTLKFLGFYPEDGNYRSVHIGG